MERTTLSCLSSDSWHASFSVMKQYVMNMSYFFFLGIFYALLYWYLQVTCRGSTTSWTSSALCTTSWAPEPGPGPTRRRSTSSTMSAGAEQCSALQCSTVPNYLCDQGGVRQLPHQPGGPPRGGGVWQATHSAAVHHHIQVTKASIFLFFSSLLRIFFCLTHVLSCIVTIVSAVSRQSSCAPSNVMECESRWFPHFPCRYGDINVYLRSKILPGNVKIMNFWIWLLFPVILKRLAAVRVDCPGCPGYPLFVVT